MRFCPALKLLASGMALCCVTSCFTGIDSTPTIKAPKLDNSVKGGRPEDSYLSDIQPLPPAQWEAGSTSWIITDPAFGLLFTPEVDSGKLNGTIATFMGFEAAPSITGDTITNMLMKLADGSLHKWQLRRRPSEVLAQESLQIPYTISLEMVDEARSRLLGKQLWPVTREWRDSADNSLAGGPFPKFIPVTITEVAPGTDLYPIRLCFDRPDGRGHAYLFLSTDKDVYASRTFPGQWRLSDPRSDYKRIADDDWKLIVAGKTAPGMTFDLVRLSLGSPERIDRRTIGSILQQTWYYSNGQTLRFEDGILTAD